MLRSPLWSDNVHISNKLVYKLSSDSVNAFLFNLKSSKDVGQNRALIVLAHPFINHTIAYYVENNGAGVRIILFENDRVVPLVDTSGGPVPSIIDCSEPKRLATTFASPGECAICLALAWSGYGTSSLSQFIGVKKEVFMFRLFVSGMIAAATLAAAFAVCVKWNQELAHNDQRDKRNKKRPFRGISNDLFLWNNSYQNSNVLNE